MPTKLVDSSIGPPTQAASGQVEPFAAVEGELGLWTDGHGKTERGCPGQGWAACRASLRELMLGVRGGGYETPKCGWRSDAVSDC